MLTGGPRTPGCSSLGIQVQRPAAVAVWKPVPSRLAAAAASRVAWLPGAPVAIVGNAAFPGSAGMESLPLEHFAVARWFPVGEVQRVAQGAATLSHCDRWT